MPSMLIEVRGSGVRELAEQFRASAEAGRVLVRGIERLPDVLQDAAAGYELIKRTSANVTWGVQQAHITRLEKYADALLNVAAGYELVAVARERAGLESAPVQVVASPVRTAAVRPVNRRVEPSGDGGDASRSVRGTDLTKGFLVDPATAYRYQDLFPKAPEPAPPRKPLVSGIYQDRERLLGQRAEVYGSGSRAEQQDYERKLSRVNRGIAKEEAPPESFGKLLLEAVGTSRFSLGGGAVSPLVNRVGRLLTGSGGDLEGGANGALVGGGALLAAGVAKSALEGFVKAVNEGAQALRTHRAAVLASGGTNGEISRLTSYGLPGEQIAALGDQLRERLGIGSGDVQALMAGGRAGIGPQLDPRLGGSQNNARLVEQATDYLRNVREVSGAEAQLLEARRLGLAGMLDTINVSRSVYEAQQRDAELRSRLFTPEQQQAARDYAAQMERLTANAELLKATAGSTSLREFAEGLGAIATLTGIAAERSEAYANALSILGTVLNITPAWVSAVQGVGRVFGGESDSKRTAAEKDTDRVVDALNKQTQVLLGMKEGLLRGGPEAAGALPPGLRRQALKQAMAANAIPRKRVNLS